MSPTATEMISGWILTPFQPSVVAGADPFGWAEAWTLKASRGFALRVGERCLSGASGAREDFNRGVTDDLIDPLIDVDTLIPIRALELTREFIFSQNSGFVNGRLSSLIRQIDSEMYSYSTI